MSRVVRHWSAARFRVGLVATCVMAAAAFAGTSTAHAVTPVADNEATVLRISGSAVPTGSAVPVGRTLTPVRLTTSDPETAVGDGTIINGPVPAVRTSRFFLPAVPAEAVTFRIDGVTVATAVPDLRAHWLQTDGGTVAGIVFNTGNVSYLIPRGPIGSASRTTGPSTLNAAAIGSVITYQYGLLPVGSTARVGAAFVESTFGTSVTSSGTAGFTLYDADAVRGNADAVAEELILTQPANPIDATRLNAPGTEVLATVTLSTGATVVVQGVRYRSNQSYGSGVTTWFFDRGALAAAGATTANVTTVVSFASTDHNLSWGDLGFGPA